MAKFRYVWKDTENGKRLFREPITPDYSSLKKEELVAQAEELGVTASGTKAEIIERLEQAGGQA